MRYDDAARKYYGQFARLNLPNELKTLIVVLQIIPADTGFSPCSMGILDILRLIAANFQQMRRGLLIDKLIAGKVGAR
jgi:hypothetical protein